MDGNVKVPIIGSQKKKYVYIGGGLIAVIFGYAAYRAHQARLAATTTTTTQGEIDPSTGFVYGTPEDAQALAALQAYQTPSANTPGGGGDVGTGSTIIQFVSNAQWSQAAHDFLVNTAGLDAPTVSAALGKYLTGSPVTEAQHSIAEQAIAAEGLPPVSGTDGFPPSIRTGAPVTNPPPAVRLKAPRLIVGSKAAHSAVLHWAPIPGATAYHIHNGASYVVKDGVTATVKRPGRYWAVAVDKNGHASGNSNAVSV